MPNRKPYIVINDQAAFDAACARWSKSDAIALDTEFVRSRTFFPKLGLLQVSSGRHIYLIDPIEVKDLSAFARILEDPKITKVFHACNEDLEVLYRELGVFPSPIFDTQMACAFLGLGHSIGYARAIKHFLKIELDKQATRTNWLQRPLTKVQLDYAAHDVEYLFHLYYALRYEIENLGFTEFLMSDCEDLLDVSRFDSSPERMYLRIGQAYRLTRQQLATLRELAAWRERTARERDLPRNFVLRSEVLLTLAVRAPRSLTELSLTSGFTDRDIFYHGQSVLRVIEKAMTLPESDWPPEILRPFEWPGFKEAARALQVAVKEASAATKIPKEVLANKRLLERHLKQIGKSVLFQKESKRPALTGWRQTVLSKWFEPVEEHFREALKAEHPAGWRRS